MLDFIITAIAIGVVSAVLTGVPAILVVKLNTRSLDKRGTNE